MSKYGNQPRTVFCASAAQATELAAADPAGRALVTGPGTLAFHLRIAEHGAGDFHSLYVAPELRGKFRTPIGGTVVEAN